MAEEDGRSRVSSRLKGYLKETPFFCKIIELILCVIAVGLIVEPFNRMQANLNHVGIVYVSLCSYILINAVLILCYLLGERLPKKMSIIFSGMGAILSCTAGLILIYNWNNYQDNIISQYLQQYLDQMVSSGVFAILAALVFAVDTYFTNKYE